MVTINGTVCDGLGLATANMMDPACPVHDAYPGSLNVTFSGETKLPDPDYIYKWTTKENKHLEWHLWYAYLKYKDHEAYPVLILYPANDGVPLVKRAMLDILADVHLRSKYDLQNGDSIILTL